MAVPISCSACGATYRIPSSLFATRFAGKDTTIKCKRCSASILVRGNLGDDAAGEVSTDPPPGESAISLPPLGSTDPPQGSGGVPLASELIESLSSQPPPISDRGPSLGAAARNSSPVSQPPPSARRSSRPAASRPWVGLRSLSIPNSTMPPPSERLVHGSGVEGRVLGASAEARAEQSAPEPEETAPPESGPRADARGTHSSVPPPVAPLLRIPAGSLRNVSAASEQPAAGREPPPDSTPTKSPPPATGVASGKPSRPSAEHTRNAAIPAGGSSSAVWWILVAVLAAAVLWYVVGRAEPTPAAPPPGAVSEQPLPTRASDSVDSEEPPGPTNTSESVDAEVPRTSRKEPAAATHDRKRLEEVLATGMREAANCDQGDGATGSVRITLSFGPSGRVSAAKLEGDPIASAPISQCILSHLRSLVIPPFKGDSFEVSRELRLP